MTTRRETYVVTDGPYTGTRTDSRQTAERLTHDDDGRQIGRYRAVQRPETLEQLSRRDSDLWQGRR